MGFAFFCMVSIDKITEAYCYSFIGDIMHIPFIAVNKVQVCKIRKLQQQMQRVLRMSKSMGYAGNYLDCIVDNLTILDKYASYLNRPFPKRYFSSELIKDFGNLDKEKSHQSHLLSIEKSAIIYGHSNYEIRQPFMEILAAGLSFHTELVQRASPNIDEQFRNPPEYCIEIREYYCFMENYKEKNCVKKIKS